MREEQWVDDLRPEQVEQVAELEPRWDEGLMVEHQEVFDTLEPSDVAVVEQQVQQRSKALVPLGGFHFVVLER